MMDLWTWKKGMWSKSIWTLLKVAISRVPAWREAILILDKDYLHYVLFLCYPLHSNFLYCLAIMEDVMGSLFLYWLWYRTTGRGNPLQIKFLSKGNNFPQSELSKEVKQMPHGTALLLKNRTTLQRRRKCPLTSSDDDPESCHWCHTKIYTDAVFPLGSQFWLMHPYCKLSDAWTVRWFSLHLNRSKWDKDGDNFMQKGSTVQKLRLVLSATKNMSSLLMKT